MVHRVDAGSHYAILRHSKNRLSQFLFSDANYEKMFSRRGAPTRRVLGEYSQIAREAGMLVKETRVDEFASDHEMDSSRRFLFTRFNHSPSEEIGKVGFILVAKNSRA